MNYNFTKILNHKRAIILKKKLTVMYCCLLMEVMMVNKYCKCIGFISNGFEKKWGGTTNLTKILSRRKRAIILAKTLT